jgi:DNA-binding protein HU-beta
VNKAELIDTIADRLGQSRKAAGDAVEAVVDTITRAVAKGEKVAITGFGVFEKLDRAARTARNPATGAKVRVKKTSVPKFRAGTQFKGVVGGTVKLPPVAKAPAAASAGAAKAAPAKATAKKAAAKKSTVTKTAAKKTTAKKTATKATPAKSAAKKATTKKAAASKATAKKAPAAKKTTAKRAPAKAGAKKTASKRTARR